MTIDNLKEKFLMLQDNHQRLREEKIRLESELNALNADYKKKLQELLKITGASSYEEAKEYCHSRESQLNAEMEQLDVELEKYLNPEPAVINPTVVNDNGTD